MKKIIFLSLLLCNVTSLLAQQHKMDNLIYEYLAKYDIEEYPDSTLLVVRGGCINDTCFLGFYLDESISGLHMSISNLAEKQLYFYNLLNGKKILFKAVSIDNTDWLRFFDRKRLKPTNQKEIKKYCAFFNTFRWDKYNELQSEIMLIFFGERKLWESEMATLKEFK